MCESLNESAHSALGIRCRTRFLSTVGSYPKRTEFDRSPAARAQLNLSVTEAGAFLSRPGEDRCNGILRGKPAIDRSLVAFDKNAPQLLGVLFVGDVGKASRELNRLNDHDALPPLLLPGLRLK
jgi:hypothetical protein